MPWSPEQYHKFQAERFAPFEDLVSLITPQPGLSVVDLGCGTGELTRRLADQLPDSTVLGIDSSATMLAKAQSQTRPGLEFRQADLATIEGRWDLVFSHAAIQWVENHQQLIPRLLQLVNPGGQLVVQQPSNHDHLSHQLITSTAAESPFVEALGGWSRQSPVLPLAQYAELLYAAGVAECTIFEKVYPHVLADSDAIVEWIRGTALVPYLERLPLHLHTPFINRIQHQLGHAMPQKPVFYGFKRILFAVRIPI